MNCGIWGAVGRRFAFPTYVRTSLDRIASAVGRRFAFPTYVRTSLDRIASSFGRRFAFPTYVTRPYYGLCRKALRFSDLDQTCGGSGFAHHPEFLTVVKA